MSPGRSEHLTYPLELTQPDGSLLPVPLSVHARHTVDDVLTAFGILDFDKTAWKQTGAIRDERTNSDLFFVTLEKSEREYSPSTLFHWESQSTTTQRSNTGQRYIRHRERNGNILLFVRPRRRQDRRTMPYTLLGLADYVSHKEGRPIQFVWRQQRRTIEPYGVHANHHQPSSDGGCSLFARVSNSGCDRRRLGR